MFFFRKGMNLVLVTSGWSHLDQTYIQSATALSDSVFTPHAQRERGEVIGRGVHIYIYIIYI